MSNLGLPAFLAAFSGGFGAMALSFFGLVAALTGL